MTRILGLVGAWALLASPFFCLAGVLAHGCGDCPDRTSCHHETDCPDDPCGLVVLRTDRVHAGPLNILELVATTTPVNGTSGSGDLAPAAPRHPSSWDPPQTRAMAPLRI
jgi:hypothetical protein